MLTQTLVPSPRGILDDLALLTFEEVDAATSAAEWAVPGGCVVDIDRCTPWNEAAFRVEVEDLGGTRWCVRLRANYSVLDVARH